MAKSISDEQKDFQQLLRLLMGRLNAEDLAEARRDAIRKPIVRRPAMMARRRHEQEMTT